MFALTISYICEILSGMKSNTALPAHRVFRALSHPARVRVVRELSGGGEKCVCDLVKACGLGWSSVSRHLSVLREAGVIADEKRGLQVFYRLTWPCVSRFIDCLDHPGRYPDLQKPAGCA
jgi:ArsR family transcriptional regulator